MAVIGLSKFYSYHGTFPEDISIRVQPKLQISDFFPYFDCLITSGAIQGILPYKNSFI